MRTLFFLLITWATYSNVAAQCLEGDCQNGRGTYQFDNGNKYAGDFRRGNMHGKGTLFFANGNRYNGDWVDGYREGTGMFTFANGNIYTGAFVKNRFKGLGTMTFASGSKYVGLWDNDLPNGTGTFYFLNGERYEGNFKNNKFDGAGTMYYRNGEKYVGDWRENVRHGKGKMVRADGTLVEGFWENGTFKAAKPAGTEGATVTAGTNNLPTTAKEELQDCNKNYCRSGKGVFLYGDGSKWIGEFKDGIPEGQGTCFYVNGDKYTGNFEKHAPNGEGTMYYKNGRILSAIWEYGRPVGDLPANSRVPQTPVQVEQNPEVKIWAVVIGVGRYNSMPVLKYSDDDAYQFYAFLNSPEGGALPQKQMKVLIDEDATRANIIQTMRQIFLRADENDVIVLYFSGHGIEGAFLPQDFDGSNNKLYHTEIKTIFEQSRAKHKICIADACHSGSLLAMKQSLNDQLQNYYRAFQESQGGIALLMSSKSEEYSLEDQGLRSGIFSHYLIRGLKGEADVDGNKIVTIREIYDFVFKNVRTYTSNAQSPTINGRFDWSMPVSMVRR